MKRALLLFLGVIGTLSTGAQHIQVYGNVFAGLQPISGALVCAYENGKFFKQTHTTDKGEFFFQINDRNDYITLIYKNGYLIEGYKVINRLDGDHAKIPIFIEMNPTSLPPDSVICFSPLLQQIRPEMSSTFLEAIFKTDPVEKKDSQDLTTQSAIRRKLTEEAIKEDLRFRSFKQSHSKLKLNGEDLQVTKITIGPDSYELTENLKNERKYYKNDKPITETTYYFETRRRFDGVLKKARRTKAFKAYKPMEHVK
ncbi:MAG: hypothetical protein U0T73_04105 [Chitinophagales bacterium]